MQCQDSILIKGESHRLTEFFSQTTDDLGFIPLGSELAVNISSSVALCS
jgi:hypothetical protein